MSIRVDVLPGNPPDWQEATITIPGLGVIECARLADGTLLDTPHFRWDEMACETVSAAMPHDHGGPHE